MVPEGVVSARNISILSVARSAESGFVALHPLELFMARGVFHARL